MNLQPFSEHIFLYRDTCNVYLIKQGNLGVLIDFGSGDVLDHLQEIGVECVTDVLMTHHHRDQGQGLQRAVEAGIHIWAPHAEQDLFQHVGEHWQTRNIYNNYNSRQDKFSLLEPVPLAGTLHDYQTYSLNGIDFTIIPTPGHTTGSITILIDLDHQKAAFSGDLIAEAGKVWTLAATQWSYNGAEGAAVSIASLLDLKDRQQTVLLPSHGEPICNPREAIDLLVERLWKLLKLRGTHPRLFKLREKPYQPVTEHVLYQQTGLSNTYVLLSDSGKALLIDYGTDFALGWPAGTDRASRRPWLYTIPALKQQFHVTKIDTVIPTHYHEDHVAGINLLREVEGTQVWAAENFSKILEEPSRYDLPCLWYDPIPVDRVLPVEETIEWEEYTLRLHPLGGHTRYSVGIEFYADGQRFLATGDETANIDGLELNYVYQSRFLPGAYAATARLYRDLNPDWILPGHCAPLKVTDVYLKRLCEKAEMFEALHKDMLVDFLDLGTEGFTARIQPYHPEAVPNQPLEMEVEVLNPFPEKGRLELKMIVPSDWKISYPKGIPGLLEPGETVYISVQILPLAEPVRRARIAADITINDHRFGQVAEALITVLPGE